MNYGVHPPKIDLRDYKVKVGATNVESFELDNLPTVKNQGSVNSCVAYTLRSILEWFNNKETNEQRELSTGFIYGMQGVAYNRLDSGMSSRDACKIVQKYGDCLFDTIPFNIEMPKCCELLKLSLDDDVYKEALTHRVKSYAKCDTKDAVEYALMKYSPIFMVVKWRGKYTFDEDGVISFDTSSSSGYHAVMAYGFNEKGWLCQNSYGEKWGNNGRFILPYDYGFAEAWSFVDAQNDDIYKPKQNTLLDILYKLLNSIINFFRDKKLG